MFKTYFNALRGKFSTNKSKEKESSPFEFAESFIDKNLKRINARKIFKEDDYDSILGPYMDTHSNLTYAEYVSAEKTDENYLLIRHDIDHDDETAVKMAKWESKRGLKSTYCILHTSWYYGPLENGRYKHSKRLEVLAKSLHDLGHEINFHNNLVCTALRQGVDAETLLMDELDYFRNKLHVPLVGTSTHGDSLCRDLNFRNWELFKECCDNKFGGPRKLKYKSNSIELGKLSMFDFGLTYEGYDVARDIYHTDSGGNQRTRLKTKGRRLFGRTSYEHGEVIGVLTHPIWWDFNV